MTLQCCCGTCGSKLEITNTIDLNIIVSPCKCCMYSVYTEGVYDSEHGFVQSEEEFKVLSLMDVEALHSYGLKEIR